MWYNFNIIEKEVYKNMKQRVISAIVALIVCIPIIIYCGVPFYIGISVIGLVGFYELMKANEEKKNYTYFIKILVIILFLLLLFDVMDIISYGILENIDVKILLSIVLILPTIFTSHTKKYDIEDAFYLLGGVLFLGLCFNKLLEVRISGLNYLWFLLLITVFSDTFAYVTGILIGKNKMCPNVSPKKTWEGFLGGTIFGTFVGTVFYTTAFDYTGSMFSLILIVVILSVFGQLGDLLFSSIKRHFGIKDFGNIMPGHGGVLDRLDSILLVVLAYSFLSLYI